MTTGGTIVRSFAQLVEDMTPHRDATVTMHGEVHGLRADRSGWRSWFELIDRSCPITPLAPSVQVSCPNDLLEDIADGDHVLLDGRITMPANSELRVLLDATRVERKSRAARFTATAQRRALLRRDDLLPKARTALSGRAARPAARTLPIDVRTQTPLRVHWIGPKHSQAQSDIERALHGPIVSDWSRVSFRDADAVAEAIHQVDHSVDPPDLIVVYRGGGSWRDWLVLNDIRVVNAVASTQLPIVTAVGHQESTPAITYTADGNFITPTDVARTVTAAFHRTSAEDATTQRERTLQSRLSAAREETHSALQSAEHLRQQLQATETQTRSMQTSRDYWRRLCSDRAEQEALARIARRGALQGVLTVMVAALAVALLSISDLFSWWLTALLCTVIGGSAVVIARALFRSRIRASRHRNPAPDAPARGSSLWLDAVDAATTPRAFRTVNTPWAP